MNSQRYFLEVPFGYTIHRMASPLQAAASVLLAASSSACVITKAMAKLHGPDTERFTVTAFNAAARAATNN